MSKKPTLTTTGAPVADNQNAITAGPRGPVLLQDYQLIAHQNRERIPERTVHAKGWGARRGAPCLRGGNASPASSITRRPDSPCRLAPSSRGHRHKRFDWPVASLTT